jgi:hypothetical protein
METATDPTTEFDDLRTKNIHSDIDHALIDHGNVEANLRESTRLTGAGREPAPHEWSGDALDPSAGTEAALRRASRMMTNARKEAFSDELQKRSGIDPDTAAVVADAVADGPPPKVRATRVDGTYLPELRDDVPVLDQLQDGNDIPRNQVKLAGRNFRDAQTAEAQQLLFELGAAQQAASDERNVRSAMSASQAERGEERAEQPVRVEPPRPQQADPVAIERAQLERERQAVRQFQTLTVQEARHAVEINNGVEFYRANQFPALNDQAAINEMAAHDPQRFQLWRDTLEALQAHQNQLATLQAQKIPYIQRQEAQANAQRDRAFAQHDEVFNKWLAVSYPNYKSGSRRAELTQAVKSYLRDDLKMTDAQIQHHYKVTGVLRDSAAQRLLADAAMWKMAQANAKNVAEKRIHAPPVQRPGVFRPHGADAEESVRGLQRELESATGERALRLAVKLTKAKRAAGHF